MTHAPNGGRVGRRGSPDHGLWRGSSGRRRAPCLETYLPGKPGAHGRRPERTAITTRSSDFGQILFGPKRQAIHMWESEPSDTPECCVGCAEAWPPVLTDGRPRASGAVDADLWGTTKREDGSTQVTCGGHPLYYYAHEGPGEVKCHNVATHGGLWWVVESDGKRAP